MSQPLTKKNFAPGSLRRPRTARTLLLRMAADEARAQRIRDTYDQRKAENPRAYTWKRLADHVGISERAVQDWTKTGGLEWNHAKKAAEFWRVDFDWLWRGPREQDETPDPFATARAAQVDDGFDEFREYVRDIRRDIADARAERATSTDAIEALLARQTGILESIERLLASQDDILRSIQRVAAGLPTDDELGAFTRQIEALEQAAAGEQGQDAAPDAEAGRARRRGRSG